MSSHSSSSAQLKFIRPEHFAQKVGSLDEWFCNLCTPPNSGPVIYMTLKMAQEHEQHSSEHDTNHRREAESRLWGLTPDADDWASPLGLPPLLTIEQIKLREHQMQVDLVQDMVPFWIKGVEAAKRGEVLRLEDYLEKLQDTWTRDFLWDDYPTQGWGDVVEGGWGPEGWRDVEEPIGKRFREKKKSHRTSKRKRRYSTDVFTSNNAYEFVETVARQEAADEQRKQRMHDFYEMSTDEKIRKIGEVIRELIATAR